MIYKLEWFLILQKKKRLINIKSLIIFYFLCFTYIGLIVF